MCNPLVVLGAAIGLVGGGALTREQNKRERIARENREAEAAAKREEDRLALEAELEAARNPSQFTTDLAPGLVFTSAEARDNYILNMGKESVNETIDNNTDGNTGGNTNDGSVAIGYDENGNPIYASDLETNIENLEGQLESSAQKIKSLEDTIKEMGDGDPEAVTKEIQNVTYTTIVQGIQEEQAQIKAKKAEQLRRTLAQRRRIGEKGRASLITGTSGGIGYSSGLIDQTVKTPPNITISKTVQ
jgi:hypothetical protein